MKKRLLQVTSALLVGSMPIAATVSSAAPQAAGGHAAQSSLPPLDLADMRLWNWHGKWHASQWDHAASPIPWRHNRIKQKKNGDTVLVLDERGAPQLQAVSGIDWEPKGLWEVDVTLPEMRDGLIVAPLWLYDSRSKDEFDFEFAGRKGLDVSIHTYRNGKHLTKTVRAIHGDFSGRRMRLGIRLDTERGIADMLVDGERVHRFDEDELGYFTRNGVKPFIEMWATKPTRGFISWTGRWRSLGKGQRLKMYIHGYRYTPD